MSRATNAQKYDASSNIPEPYPSGFTVVSARRRAFPFVAGCGPGLLDEIMAGGFTKLFSDIVDSSIWDLDSDTCKVWVTLLALSNGDGYIRGSVSWLAKKARVSIEKCQSAVEEFSRPDPYSRTPDNDGRRVEVLEDGFLILNYLLFRDRLSSNPTAIKTRERVRKHRERYTALRNAPSVTSVTLPLDLASASGVQGGEGRGTGEGGPPVEFPPRFPETQDAAVPAAGVSCAAPEPFIRDLWSKAASRGGRDAKDIPIRSWPHYVASQWSFDKQRVAKEAANRPPPREMSARELRKAHIIK